MYKETVTTNKKMFFVIMGIIVVSLVSFGLVDALNVEYKLFIQLGMFIVIGMMVYFLIKFQLSDYKYALIESELIFQKIVGRREHVVLSVMMNEINDILPYSKEEEENYKSIPKELVYNVSKKLGKDGVMVCIFTKDNYQQKVYFEPSEKLRIMIENRRKHQWPEDGQTGKTFSL